MAAETRIYLVTRDGQKPRLIRASHPSQVRAYIARDFEVGVAGQDELIAAVGEGAKVEDAGAEAPAA